MLRVLSGEDLSQVDVESEEGFKVMEEMVQEKMAEKLVQELEKALSPDNLAQLTQGGGVGGAQHEPGAWTMRSIFTGDLFDLASDSSSAVSKKETFKDVIDKMTKEKAAKKNLGELFDVLNNNKKKDIPTKTRKKDEAEDLEEKKKEEDVEVFDQEMERKVRSDVVSEEDMIEDLYKEMSKMSKLKQEEIAELTGSEEFRRELEGSLEDIIRESERELGTKLDRNAQAQDPILDGYSDSIKDLMAKLDKAQAEIARVNNEIVKVQELIEKEDELTDEDLEQLTDLKRDGKKSVKKELREEDEDEALEEEYDHERHLKWDNKRSVKRELRDEDEDLLDEDMIENEDALDPETETVQAVTEDEEEDSSSGKGESVQVKVTDLTPNKITTLKNSPTEGKVTKRLESVLKEKLNKAGLDTGGRQIEVKLVTSSFVLGGDADEEGGGPNGLEGMFNQGQGQQEVNVEEAQQFQQMIYNLMVSQFCLPYL